MESVIGYLERLYKSKNQISLLSYFYGFLTIVFIMIAGIIALLNQSLGVSLLIVPIITFVSLCANVVVWALIKMVIEELISNKKRTQSRKAKK